MSHECPHEIYGHENNLSENERPVDKSPLKNKTPDHKFKELQEAIKEIGFKVEETGKEGEFRISE